MKRFNRVTFVVVLAIIAVLAILLLPQTRVSTREQHICAICGASEQRTRNFGLSGDVQFEPSALTTWLDAHKVVHDHRWQFLSSTGRTLFGRAVSAGSSTSRPPIASVASGKLHAFLEYGSESDIMHFVHVMTTGALQEQEAVILKYDLE